MHRILVWLHAHLSPWRKMWSEEFVALLLVAIIFAAPASAAMRFQERSMYMNSARPGDTTSYTISFRYMSPQLVGSVDILFCTDPIPYHPCVKPAGLNVSGAQLTAQSGEVGFSILSKNANHIVLTRPPAMATGNNASYTFENMVNPTNTAEAFAVRLRSHLTTDATGPQIDFGSVRAQVTTPIMIETQVPPMLIFCMAEEVQYNCAGTNENYYTDMGELSSDSTLTAQSQMAVGTNASGGFAITANGFSMSAGTSVIEPLSVPTPSVQGQNQFGINLVENNSPQVGDDPEGEWANAIAAPDYSIPNKYKYVSGDVVAFSPNVSLMKKFTVSYVANAREDLKAGVYSTTITYIATGRF